jgi:excisionase family DNA binding protein
MLGFGGHFSTKSRRYSTTLGALRRARVAYAIRRRRGNTVPLDAWGRPEGDQAVIVVASWCYLGRGYQSTGRRGWPPRRPLGRGKRGGSPRKSYELQRSPREQARSRAGRMERLLTVDEAAERLGTSARFIRRLIAERRIAYTKLGRHVRIAARDLDTYVASGRVEPRSLAG